MYSPQKSFMPFRLQHYAPLPTPVSPGRRLPWFSGVACLQRWIFYILFPLKTQRLKITPWEVGKNKSLQKMPHQNPTSPPAPLPWGEGSMLHKKQKALTKPRPHPRPLSHGERGACFIKNKKPSPKPTKSPGKHETPKPHHLMKCEKGTWLRHVPFSHFGGRGGTGPPTKKTKTSIHGT